MRKGGGTVSTVSSPIELSQKTDETVLSTTLNEKCRSHERATNQADQPPVMAGGKKASRAAKRGWRGGPAQILEHQKK